jgi:hypothetical protein
LVPSIRACGAHAERLPRRFLEGRLHQMIGLSRKPSDLRQAVGLYLGTVPAGAPIHGVLASLPIEKQLQDFDAADRTAMLQQRRYWRAGRVARLAAVLGLLVVPVDVLLPLQAWLPAWALLAVQVLRGLALVLTFIAVILLGVRRSATRWKQARGQAEKARGEFFRTLIPAGAAAGALDQALACFKAAHLDWQAGFYDKRIRELPARIKAQASGTAPFRLVGIALSIGAALLGAVTVMKFLMGKGLLLAFAPLLGWFPEPALWQHGLNATAAGLLAFAGARFLTYEDLSSAALYPWARAEIARIESDGFKAAQAAAARGDLAAVQAFCHRIQRIFDTEHGVWSSGVPTAR